jgi:hypothetical protein
MSLSKNPALYTDIPPILDAVIANGGGIITFDTPAQAFSWRLRAHHYRANIAEPGHPYGCLRLTIEDNAVRLTVVNLAAQLTDLMGNPIKGEVKGGDLATAMKLARRLGIDDGAITDE